MNISMYEASIPVLIKALSNLAGILAKAEAHAAARNIEPSVLLGARLYPDMYPLVRQVQIATDLAKGCASRLAGELPPRFADDETSFSQLQERIARTIALLRAVEPEQINGTEEAMVSLTVGGRERSFRGLSYLFEFVLPNVYFHITTAYAILRHWGVELGKADFLGDH